MGYDRSSGAKLRNALLIAGVIMMLSAFLYEPLFAAGAVVTLSCLIPDFLFNKCAHCGKHLGRNAGAFCQFCGERIE